MRMQNSQANCGSTALYNAACVLGVNRPLDECEKACAVSATDGTPTKNLLKGIKAIGLTVVCELKETRADVALLRLADALSKGQLAILAVDDDSHWVTAVGRGGSRYLVADSADSELVLAYSNEGLGARWLHKAGKKARYYGVVIS